MNIVGFSHLVALRDFFIADVDGFESGFSLPPSLPLPPPASSCLPPPPPQPSVEDFEVNFDDCLKRGGQRHLLAGKRGSSSLPPRSFLPPATIDLW